MSISVSEEIAKRYEENQLMNRPNLVEHFKDNPSVIDYRLRVVNVKNGVAECYLHPLNADGETVDIEIHGDWIEVQDKTPCQTPS